LQKQHQRLISILEDKQKNEYTSLLLTAKEIFYPHQYRDIETALGKIETLSEKIELLKNEIKLLHSKG
ncbi:unnamed protein product, partial [marine sediment metagenome]